MAPSFDRVDRLMETAVAERAFPDAVLLVALDGQPVLHRSYGRAGLDTVFDLASLTKPLATTASAMRLVARGELSEGARLEDLVPEADRPGLRGVRLFHLLGHCSGLPAWRPLFREVEAVAPSRRRAALRRLLLELAPEARPGERAVYSDLGFLLLEWAIERASGMRLDRLFAREIARPLRLARTFFVDLARPAAARLAGLEIAPGGRSVWRRRRLRAEVDDDNAAAMGGVAGHAGLFSTAHEVHLLARELVLAWQGQPSLFEAAVVRRFWRARPVPAATRALGWDRPSDRGASCGHFFTRQAVGHLGFTGTSLWIEPGRALWVVLLTNRVHYGLEPNPMRAFRPRLHDAVMNVLRRPRAVRRRG